MFSAQFITEQVHQIKDNIVLPDTGFFVRNENSIRLCYLVDGKFMYIIIPSRHAVAQYLVDNGHIDSFAVKNVSDVILYRNSFYWDFDHKGKPVMVSIPKEVAWEKIRLTKSDVQLLAARKECDRCMAGIPLEKAAVMYTPAKYNF